ncbi:adenylyltransferase/cytidyltransferase family protein [Candidatus Gottesmanbacteria bacterium]|nr:adenylyltransferase/cytidyltransferase family protein [Candidatus Gottesmanbacteria bacterium]
MTNKIFRFSEIDKLLSKMKKECPLIVLVGGCFDIVHIGHIKFLTAVKRSQSCLIVILENDAKVKKLKGTTRPSFTQLERAEVMASLSVVDFVILLPEMKSDRDYQELVVKLSPNFIGATEDDPLLKIKKSLADTIGDEIIIVPKVEMHSTTKIAQLMELD